jgi:hypothetical protein
MSYRALNQKATAPRRSLLGLNAGLRLAYGVGAALAPQSMEALRLAPALPERPDGRLFVRAFGGHMILVAALGLAAVLRRRGERGAAAAALGIDLADIGVALVEAQRRGRLEPDLSGGLVISGLGAATAALAFAASEP